MQRISIPYRFPYFLVPGPSHIVAHRPLKPGLGLVSRPTNAMSSSASREKQHGQTMSFDSEQVLHGAIGEVNVITDVRTDGRMGWYIVINKSRLGPYKNVICIRGR